MPHNIDNFIDEFLEAGKNKPGITDLLEITKQKPKAPLYNTFWSRLKDAWLILTCKAHAVTVGNNWQPSLNFGIKIQKCLSK